MPDLRRIRNNLLSLATAEVLTKVLGVALYALLARYLGPAEFGIYALAVSFSMIFGMLANLGTDSYLVREIAREQGEADRLLSAGWILKVLGGLVGLALAVAFAYLLRYEPRTRMAICIFSLTLLFSPVNNLFDSVFRGFQRMEYSALLKIGRSLLTFTIIGTLMLLGKDLLLITAAHALTGLLLVCLMYLAVVRRRFCRVSLRLGMEPVREVLFGGLPFLAIGAIYIVNAKTDVLMLSKLASVEYVGLYDAANQLILVLLVLPSLISQVLYPVLSSQAGRDGEGLAKIVNFTMRILVAVGVPVSFGAVLLAPRIVGLLYGDRFAEAAIVLQIMGAGLSTVFVRSTLSWVLAAVGRVKIMMWINFLNLLVNAGLNYLLIPRYLHVGAAVATISSMLLSTLCVLMVVKKSLPNVRSLVGCYVKPLLSAFLMSAFILRFPQLNLFVHVAAGFVIYGGSFGLIGGLSKEEWGVLRGLAGRRQTEAT